MSPSPGDEVYRRQLRSVKSMSHLDVNPIVHGDPRGIAQPSPRRLVQLVVAKCKLMTSLLPRISKYQLKPRFSMKRKQRCHVNDLQQQEGGILALFKQMKK